jgi:hypothetical protein
MAMLTTENILIFVLGVLATWLLQQFLKRTIGTSYRTQSQCEECSVRASMNVIRTLVVELAIKAGVPPHEVAKIVASIKE